MINVNRHAIKISRRALFVAAIVATAAGTAVGDTAQTGEGIFVTKGCNLCHGYAGQGALLTGPRLGPQPLALPAFTAAVRRPRNEMPAYAPSVLSDADIESIYRYLQSLPAAPDPTALGVFPEP